MENLAKGTMCLSLNERKSVIAETATRYRKAKKNQRKIILNELESLTELNRGYLSWTLRKHGTNQYFKSGNKTYVLKTDLLAKNRGHRPKVYYEEKLISVLKIIWDMSRNLNSKRLAVFIRDNILSLNKIRELALTPSIKEKLIKISPATLDRILSPHKAKVRLRGLSHTRPAKLFLRNVPILTSFDKPTMIGNVQIDLVGHDGGDVRGEFCFTLTMTDIATGWTLVKCIRNKAQRWVVEAIRELIPQFPFPILSIHSDSGSEFINKYLVAFCKDTQIRFTRSRPGRKNDNCHVEQKNDSIVRNVVGYFRYEGIEMMGMINSRLSRKIEGIICIFPLIHRSSRDDTKRKLRH